MKSHFATAINCMDGRVQLPVIAWLKEKYNVDYVDMLTEPGPDKLLSQNGLTDIKGLQKKIEISVKQHGSNIIAVVGHADCAGNPVKEKQHRSHIKKSVKKVARSQDQDIEVIGLWVDKKFKVKKVA